MLFLFISSLLMAQPSARFIMEKMDQLTKPIDVQTQLKMTLISSKGNKERRRSRELISIEKKYEDGKFKSKSLLRFSQPKEIMGTGFLTWDRLGSESDDQWLYLPALKKVKRIRTKEKGRSFMGTDFSYEDLSGRDLDADEYELMGEDIIHGADCYKVKANPIEKGSHYSSRIVWVDKKYSLMKRVEFFNKKGTMFKILDIPDHVKNGDYWTATKMIMKNLKNNHRTEMVVLKVDYDQDLKNNVFTESFLKRN
ncbi:MAG: outer membrane lipoprotein-sorting protein [Candidatus Marinimicrobia bacterium]|nr:outer membrane lipoprotein-sorting protein [Candidatus Neomarinimicrobiota bacterium]MBT4068420.1 outer membrane lipoprotein-sorting protein [Candidatus Neomarinimicrobiota bacterium]MBT7194043.1 outer membrane lipoprotein-sorting protein [Candidatus Neomarinimicrobiota bacterium]